MSTDLDNYYQTVEEMGQLRTPEHAKRWSGAILKTLGLSLDSKAKKKLSKELPEELSYDLTRFIWVLHFRDKSKTCLDFQTEVARRSGNSDITFAKIPIKAVFHALKEMVDNDTSDSVSNSLSPELSQLWQEA